MNQLAASRLASSRSSRRSIRKGVGRRRSHHLAGAWASRGKRVVSSTPIRKTRRSTGPGSARRGSGASLRHRRLARGTLHHDAELARDADHVVIDGPPRVASLATLGMLASIVLIPVQPSPLDGWASAVWLCFASATPRPSSQRWNSQSLCGARTVIARETAQALAST